jgi:uncharacterized damage-inducible protein DinB
MSVSAEVLRQHLGYTAWASDHLVRAVSQIPPHHLTHDFQTADRTILGTLVHTFGADRIWLKRILGESPAIFLTDDDHRLIVLQQEWPAVLAGWQDWARPLTDEQAAAILHLKDLKGNLYTYAVWQVVLHVVNHATHHRGQVSGFLRTLGHTPPQLDLTRYYRGS